MPAGLHHVSASIETARGEVVSSWAQNQRTFELDVTVPVNATATVSVPLFGHGKNSVTADHRATFLHVEGDTAIYTAGSGHWHFTTHL